MRLGIGLDIATLAVNRSGGAPALAMAALTGTFSLAESAAAGIGAGTVGGGTAGSTWTLTDDAGGRVALSGTSIVRGATALDYETAPPGRVYPFTILQTKAGYPPLSTTLYLAVTDATEVSISGTPGAATQGAPYTFTPTTPGGWGTKTFGLTGSLPAGLSFNTSTGAITGTPTTTGTTSGLNITVTDDSGSAALGAFSIVVGAAAGTPLVRPNASFTGALANSQTPAPLPTTPTGTIVQDKRPNAVFAEMPYGWITGSGNKVTALITPPQSSNPADPINYFDHADVFYEGGTATITSWSINDTPRLNYDGTTNPQGSVGITVEIGAGVGGAPGNATAGDAVLYMDIYCTHGLPRRISLNHVNNVDRSLSSAALDFTANITSAATATLAPNQVHEITGELLSDSLGRWLPASGQRTLWFGDHFSRPVTFTNGSASVSWTGNVTANGRTYFGRNRYYVDFANGNDANAGNKPGAGFAWKNPWGRNGAAYRPSSGSEIICAPGNYTDGCPAGSTVNRLRVIEIKSSTGNPDDVTIAQGSRFQYTYPSNMIDFQYVTIDASKCQQMVLSSLSGAAKWGGMKGCKIIDPNGVFGPSDGNGYLIGWNTGQGTLDGGNLFFAGGTSWYLRECYASNYLITGAKGYRNTLNNFGADCWTTNDLPFRDFFIDGFRCIGADRTFRSREHEQITLSIESGITRDVVNNRTSFVIAAPTGAYAGIGPDPTNVRHERTILFVTGANAGLELELYELNTSTRTVTVKGDATGIAVGDGLRHFLSFHPDLFQMIGLLLGTQKGMDNGAVSRYVADSPVAQPFLPGSSGGAFTGGASSDPAVGDGLDITFTSNRSWREGDSVYVQTGPAAGQVRWMTNDGTTTTGGRINKPFTVATGAATVDLQKSNNNVGFYLNILDKTFQDDALAQFSGGYRNFVFFQNTFRGRQTSSNAFAQFRNNSPWEDGAWIDNIIDGGISAQTPPAPSTATGCRWQNNLIAYGANPTPGQNTMSAVTLGSDYVPGSGTPALGHAPICPFALDPIVYAAIPTASAVTSSNKIGAVKA